jgi:ABC-type oligopeptide transport system substrate-binding subunit
MPTTRRLLPVLAAALAVCAAALSGCGPSDNIRELQPPPQPALSELESHLDYVDPDEGRPSYVVRGNQ